MSVNPGLDLMTIEMERQRGDALATLDHPGDAINSIVGRSGRRSV